MKIRRKYLPSPSALIRTLAGAEFVFFLLPMIMLLLIAGTVAQSTMGLYAAHKMFFSSFLVWAGPLPLPGGYVLLGLLTLSLLIRFVFFSPWSWRKAGIILTHLGVLVLLIGGIAAALQAREGFMIIPEGSATPYIYDYRQRTLFIFKNDVLERKISFEDLAKHAPDTAPLAIKIETLCRNCEILRRADAAPQDRPLQDLAQFMALAPKQEEKEPEENIAGLGFTLEGLKDGQNGYYIAFEGMPRPIEISAGAADYKIIFGREQRLLPFSLRLKNFHQENYPGTDKAKNYHSDIEIIDGALAWPYRIEMNKPLRYKNYTFYQSSFDRNSQDGENMETTILTVVENKGRLFPYLGTFILAAGLLLHLALILKERKAS